jgi:hypothetical protein
MRHVMFISYVANRYNENVELIKYMNSIAGAYIYDVKVTNALKFFYVFEQFSPLKNYKRKFLFDWVMS